MGENAAMKETAGPGEDTRRALLLGVRDERTSKTEADSLFRELGALTETLGVEIAGRELIQVRGKQPRYGIGTGKAEEIAEKAAALGVDCLIFDRDLSPSQQRNWEALTGLSAVDRQELILQIFAQGARTREAALQVHLAELVWSLPRLQHRYIDLSRQRGGRYGTRGAGETRLETDRRLVEERIHQTESELAQLARQRQVQRKQRERSGIPVIALAGYTNAGKSSLLNALTGAGVLAEDRLFATLDATGRRLELAGGRQALLVDTVGFIRALPHALIRAFHSTLEEVCLANLIIHVQDASDPDLEPCRETTLQVLRELGAERVPRISVLNKIDRLDGEVMEGLLHRCPGEIPLSCSTGQGLEDLRQAVEDALAGRRLSFRFPLNRTDLPALLHRKAQVLSEVYQEDHIAVEALADPWTEGKLREFVVREEAGEE